MRRRPARSLAIGLLLALGVRLACGSGAPASVPAVGIGCRPGASRLGTLDVPLYLTAPAGDRPALFIVEKAGRHPDREGWRAAADAVPRPGRPGRRPAAASRACSASPSIPTTPPTAASWCTTPTSAGNTVIVDFPGVRRRSRPGRPGHEQVMLTAEQPFANHNGGQILFGPGGMLYIGLGDGGSGGDPQGRGQYRDRPARVYSATGRRSAGACYTVPPDNPFVGRADARPEVWSYGLRNPWRFTFDPATGDLYVADVGQNAWEEVDVAPAADGAGEGQLRLERHRRHALLRREPCDQSGADPSGAGVLARRGMFDHGRIRLPRALPFPPCRAIISTPTTAAGWVRSFRLSGWPGGRAAAVARARAGRARHQLRRRMPRASSTC